MTTKTIIKMCRSDGMLQLTFFFSSNVASGIKQREDLLDVLINNRFGNRAVHKINDKAWHIELNNYMWNDDDDMFMDLCAKTHQILKCHRYIISKKHGTS